jgi:hypothetical protein
MLSASASSPLSIIRPTTSVGAVSLSEPFRTISRAVFLSARPRADNRLSRPSPSTTLRAICCGIGTAFMAATFGRVWLRCKSRKSYGAPQPLAESIRRAAHRLDPQRVSGPLHHPSCQTSKADSGFLFQLLPRVEDSPRDPTAIPSRHARICLCELRRHPPGLDRLGVVRP